MLHEESSVEMYHWDVVLVLLKPRLVVCCINVCLFVGELSVCVYMNAYIESLFMDIHDTPMLAYSIYHALASSSIVTTMVTVQCTYLRAVFCKNGFGDITKGTGFLHV